MSSDYRLYRAVGKTSLGFSTLRLAARPYVEAMEIAKPLMVRIDTLTEAGNDPDA